MVNCTVAKKEPNADAHICSPQHCQNYHNPLMHTLDYQSDMNFLIYDTIIQGIVNSLRCPRLTRSRVCRKHQIVVPGSSAVTIRSTIILRLCWDARRDRPIPQSYARHAIHKILDTMGIFNWIMVGRLLLYYSMIAPSYLISGAALIWFMTWT